MSDVQKQMTDIDRIYEAVGEPDSDGSGQEKVDAILQWIKRTMAEWEQDQKDRIVAIADRDDYKNALQEGGEIINKLKHECDQLRHDLGNSRVIAEDWERESEQWEMHAREGVKYLHRLVVLIDATDPGTVEARENAQHWLREAASLQDKSSAYQSAQQLAKAGADPSIVAAHYSAGAIKND